MSHLKDAVRVHSHKAGSRTRMPAVDAMVNITQFLAQNVNLCKYEMRTGMVCTATQKTK